MVQASEKPETRARMSALQHDELLTQSEILEKETLPPAKEADQKSILDFPAVYNFVKTEIVGAVSASEKPIRKANLCRS